MPRLILTFSLTILVLLPGAPAHCQATSTRFSLGAQYTYYRNQHGFFLNDSLLGPRFDVRILPHAWLTSQVDVGLSFHPHPGVSSIAGGRILLGRFGTRIGKQGERIGVFAEARGGFVTWSDVLLFWDFSPSTGGIRFGRLTKPLFNVGGTLEIYPKRRFGVRLTAGDSMVFHGDRQVLSIESAFPGFIAHNADISTGLFYRF